MENDKKTTFMKTVNSYHRYINKPTNQYLFFSANIYRCGNIYQKKKFWEKNCNAVWPK